MALQPQERPGDTPNPLPVGGDQPNPTDEFEAAFDTFAKKLEEEPPESSDTAGAETSHGDGETQLEPAAAKTPTQPTGEQPSPSTAAPSKEVVQKPAAYDWTKAPPEVRAAYDADLAAWTRDKEQLEQQNTRMRGQVSALARKGRPTPTPATGSAPDAGDRAQPKPVRRMSAEDLKKVREDYPELAPVVESVESLHEETERLRASNAAENAHRTEAYYDDQFNQLLGLHPDYEQIVRKPDGTPNKDFIDYVAAQPEWFQELVNKNGKELEDLKAADFVMRSYKDAHGIAVSSSSQPQSERSAPSNPMAARRAEQLRGSTAVSSRGGASGSGPPDDFEASFEFYSTQKKRN